MNRLKLGATLFALTALWSCEQDAVSPTPDLEEVPTQIISQLNAAGFNTVDFDVKKLENGYIVEKDIILTEDQISSLSPEKGIPTVEQSTGVHGVG